MGRTSVWLIAGFVALVVLSAFLFVTGTWRWFYYDLRGYSVGAPAETWPAERPGSAEPLRIAALGDPGTVDSGHDAVSAAIEREHEAVPYDALLLLGDLAYPDGDVDRLDEVVLEPFVAMLGPQVEVVPALGNHDYDQGQSEQIMARLGRDDPWYAEQVDDVLFVVLDSNQADDPTQTAWLEDVLSASQARWTIAVMHHPAYSAGPQGSEESVRDAWTPLFAQYGVDLVLAGHDHDYQRSEPIDGVVYVVSGGGGAETHQTGTEAFTEFSAGETLHFLDLQVTRSALQGQAIGTDGRAFDEFTITPNR